MVAVVLTTLDVPVAVEVCFNRSIRCRSGLEAFSLAPHSSQPSSWTPDPRSLPAPTSFDPLSTAFLFLDG